MPGGGLCLMKPAEQHQDVSEIEMRFGMTWIERDRTPDHLLGFIISAKIAEHFC